MIFTDIKKYIKAATKGLVGLSLLVSFGALSSCSSDDELSSDISDIEVRETFTIALNVKVPTNKGTRAETDNDKAGDSSEGQMRGTDEENALYSAMLYFCDADNKNIVSFEINGIPDPVNGLHTLKTEVEIDEIKGLAGKEVNLFVVGNYSFAPVHNFAGNVKADDALISVSDIDAKPIGDFRADNYDGRLMTLTNISPFVVDFTNITGSNEEVIEALQGLFTKENNNTFTLRDKSTKSSTIDVERAVARIDWKDLPREEGTGIENKYLPENTYHLGNSAVLLKTYSMQVINVNNKSYLFRHTAEGTLTEADNSEVKLFGKEKDNKDNDNVYNWFAGHDWGSNATKNATGLRNKVNRNVKPYVVTATTGHEGKIKISDLMTRTLQDGYYPWRYVTENTIPSADLMSEENLWDNATGVAFTFQILGVNQEALKPADLGNDNCPHGITKTNSGSTDNTITVTMPDASWMNVDWDSTNEGYFLTYYAFIKHNDATDTEVDDPEADGGKVTYPAPMKYAVVRNNVYRLHVNTISVLPLPEKPRSMFLELQVDVKPWNVRRNDFTF